MGLGGGWVIDLDIRQFLDRVDRTHLGAMLDNRVRDGVIRRAVGKWLNAGVMEDGAVSRPERGTPQGGVISPLLANIYLHTVLDTWFETEVRPRLRGGSFMVRYADDAVLCFADEADARRVLEVLPKRLARFGLELNEQKTRLVEFLRPDRSSADAPRGLRPWGEHAFDFLGFTHCWKRSREGYWIVSRTTASSRFGRSLKRVSDWCRRNRHEPLDVQQTMLNRALRGHYAYFGITGNAAALGRFRYEVWCRWRHWLGRRSSRGMSWRRYMRLESHYRLAPPRLARSMPGGP